MCCFSKSHLAECDVTSTIAGKLKYIHALACLRCLLSNLVSYHIFHGCTERLLG